MRQPWSKTNVDGASFRSSDGELDRLYDEMPSLPEPPAQAEGDAGGAASSPPPQTRPQTIAPAEAAEEEPAECVNPTCADAFENAAESGAPLVEGSGSGCTDRREINDASKTPNPDRRGNS